MLAFDVHQTVSWNPDVELTSEPHLSRARLLARKQILLQRLRRAAIS